jgi:hypothetical protein
MEATIDRARLPQTAAYFASLPNGLESFPSCRIRDIAVEPYANAFGSIASEPGLPPAVADLLRGSAKKSAYPEVVFQVAHLVVRDLAFASDAAYFEWQFQANVSVFDRPILRNLMRLVSPTLVVLGATKRWTAFHEGTDLTAGRIASAGARSETLAYVKYPARLFSRLFLVGLEQAFLAALLASRAKDPRVKLGGIEESAGPASGKPQNAAVASYECSWIA